MASLTTIAKQAGVSITAASLVLNKKDHGTRVSAECAKKIRTIAKQLGYVPNYHASSIKKGRSDTIAVAMDIGEPAPAGDRIMHVSTALALPYFGMVIGGIEAVMRGRGYLMTLVGPDAKLRAPDRGLVAVRQRRFDGMIVLGTLVHIKESTVQQDAPEYPIVVMEPTVESALPCVDFDETKGVTLILEHLASLGHKRILWIGPEATELSAYRPIRYKLFQDQCKSMGLHSELLFHRPSTGASDLDQYYDVSCAAREAMARRLSSGPRDFTAVVAYNDNSASGALDAITDAGLSVPKDISVVGYDDFEGRRCRPMLTSVDHRLGDMGVRAAEILMEMIADPSLVNEYRNMKEKIEPRLSVRQSTGPAVSR